MASKARIAKDDILEIPLDDLTRPAKWLESFQETYRSAPARSKPLRGQLPIPPHDRATVISDRCWRVNWQNHRHSKAAQGGGGDLEVGVLLHGGLDHGFEGVGLDVGDVGVHALDLEAERGGEVLFIADHDIDVVGDFPVHFLGLGEAADGFPERRAVVEVVGDGDAVAFGGFAGFDGEFGGAFGEAGEDAAGVAPADTELAEDVIRFTTPFREKIIALENDSEYLRKVTKMGAEKANESANKTMQSVRELIGIKKFY